MNTAEELDIITRMRGEVMSRKDITGENLFLAWGYPTAIILFIEYLALTIWNENWCVWLWAGIPLIGAPLMIHYLRVDYKRTHHRTHEQGYILTLWIFIGEILLLLSGTALWPGVFPDGHHPGLPSEDRLWHHRLSALHHPALSTGRILAIAAPCDVLHRHHCAHHSRPSV